MDNYWARKADGKIKRRSVLRGGAAAGGAASVWLLAGCGDDGSDPPPTLASGTSSSSAPSSSVTAHPRRVGTIAYSIQGEPPNLDVHKHATSYVQGYGPGAAYSGLIKPQATGHKGAVVPVGDLAESWEQPDSATYIFKIRQNAKFHNISPVNGRAATAQDVVFSFQRQISEKVNASYLGGIKTMAAVDPTTLRIELTGPNVDFISTLAAPHTKVIAPEVVQANSTLETAPVIGTGPWIWKEWKKGVSETLDRNPEYFIPELPYADRLFFPVIKDQAQIEAQFLAGQLTVVSVAVAGSGLPPKRMDQLDKSTYGVFQAPGYGASAWVWFNQDFPQFKDQRVRRALSLAIDRQFIIDTVFEQLAVLDAIGSPIPGPDWRLSQDELKRLMPYDPKSAKAQLDQAGGLPKQSMPVFESAATQAMAQIVQQNFKDIGFETEIALIDPIGLTGGIYSPTASRYSIATANANAAPSLTANLEQYFTVGGSRNSMKINDKELEGLILAQKVEFDANKRKAIVNDIERMIIDKAYMCSLGAPLQQHGFRLTSHNIEFPVLSAAHQIFSEWWFDA